MIKLTNLLDRKLAGKTLYISGASRGIGKAIALKAAQDGAKIVIAAKTAEAHPKLPGTIYTAAEESKSLSFSLLLVQLYVALVSVGYWSASICTLFKRG